MNKFAIPTILAVTVMVAGMFAFMPVEQASTVHTTGTTTLGAGSITAATMGTDAIDGDAIATSAVTEISGALTRIIPVSDSTAINSVQGTTQTSTYTLTVDEVVIIHAIEITGDITSFSTSADLVQVSRFTNDGVDFSCGVNLVSKGNDAAAETIELFISEYNLNCAAEYPNYDFVLTPNLTTGFAVDIEVTEFGSNDPNTAIPITVTFYISGSSTANPSIAVT